MRRLIVGGETVATPFAIELAPFLQRLRDRYDPMPAAKADAYMVGDQPDLRIPRRILGQGERVQEHAASSWGNISQDQPHSSIGSHSQSCDIAPG